MDCSNGRVDQKGCGALSRVQSSGVSRSSECVRGCDGIMVEGEASSSFASLATGSCVAGVVRKCSMIHSATVAGTYGFSLA